MCLYGRVHACWVANFLSISSKRRKRKASSLTLNIIHKTRNKEKEIPTTTRILNWIGLRSFFWLLLITIICLFVLCLKLGELWLLALKERNFTLGPPHIIVCDLHQHCAFVFICGSYGCQNPDLILWFYNLTYPKRSGSFKSFCNHSGSVGSYDFDDSKQPWFLVTFFNLTEDSVGPKWKMKSQ